MSLLMPSQRNVHSPVSNLDRDVFLSIINLNADLFSDPTPLGDTRRASQVCRDWRDMILDAPSLWGKLIDLDDLAHSTEDWRDTVLQRSGNASLWIKATDQIYHEETHVRQKIYGFLFSVLDKHWGRTEKLVVCVDIRDLDTKLWRSIYRPAPQLRVFDVDLYGTQNRASSTPSFNLLFANNAPLLHTLHVANIKFNPRAPWVTGIRLIHIGPPFTLLEMLSAFKMMPNLETIRIEQVQRPRPDKEEVDHRQCVNLPNLSQIQLYCDFKSTVTLLENITYARGCFLKLTSGNWKQGPFRPLSKFALDYFTARVPTSLSLSVSHYRFSFKDRTENRSPFESFSVSVWFDDLPLPTLATANIIAGFTFPAPVFHFVTQLYLTSLNCSPSEAVHLFFRSLPAVTTLITNEQVIGNFFGLQKGTPDILLPLIEVVKLDTLDFRATSGYLFQFLVARRESGHPILVLDLRDANPDLARSLTYLADFTGMQVLWKRRESTAL
ncbi:hypothetical protein GALMADRAFT_137393 [Galerina marginata CBS 339.88]|uniref:Uncharacterized protein n=1 Tax=Galerina marginata (strain CBS 339.88) TaxID=685588 RepID=A0A067T8S0_GALM3|nr:hypothetical protein GALMADRAFT_137393 [Galerina marginata CBS 339.88]